ncbi:type II secretion system protein GspG [Aquimarina mytili]|uniref:Type II secretion system protein GspG n=1 Tax=Aquimarina mytili TaxID=874423 RepID=A0A936ZWV2_9FLAO|nr:type II secretion system protein GspG [Aquimarina mytili]MBL0686148.1 type II secretion system protein GspG [Aquimarina mytili]
MFDLIAELLLLFEELKFWKKKKKRRKLEKEKGLPKKTMIHPVTKVLFIGLVLTFILGVMLRVFYTHPNESKTTKKIVEVKKILEKQYKDLGKYPTKLKDIINNNPLRKNINLDAWGNEFYYKQIKDGLSYELKSKGKDGILNTEDDLK